MIETVGRSPRGRGGAPDRGLTPGEETYEPALPIPLSLYRNSIDDAISRSEIGSSFRSAIDRHLAPLNGDKETAREPEMEVRNVDNSSPPVPSPATSAKQAKPPSNPVDTASVSRRYNPSSFIRNFCLLFALFWIVLWFDRIGDRRFSLQASKGVDGFDGAFLLWPRFCLSLIISMGLLLLLPGIKQNGVKSYKSMLVSFGFLFVMGNQDFCAFLINLVLSDVWYYW